MPCTWPHKLPTQHRIVGLLQRADVLSHFLFEVNYGIGLLLSYPIVDVARQVYIRKFSFNGMRAAAGVSGELDHRSKLLAVTYFRSMSTTEIRTYEGLTGTQALDGYAGLRIGQHYAGVLQEYDTVLVLLMGAMVSGGVMVSNEEWAKWFRK
jgi:hypothetical protein